jgi:hypothetical protein
VRALCQLNAQVGSLERSFKTSALPAYSTKATSCTALDLRYDLGLVAALLGLAVAAIGFVWMMSRSRRAASAGAPWPIRRAMDATARWLDARLPGRTGLTPRVRGGYLATLSATLVFAGAVGAVALWTSHERSEQLQTYETATAALKSFQLPSSIRRVPDTCGSTVCAVSTLNPPQVGPMLRRLLHGASIPALTAFLPCGGPCPVTMVGHFDGALATGIAFWKFGVTRDGKVPNGATPLRPGTRARPGVPYAYFLGSEVYIDTIDPREDDD